MNSDQQKLFIEERKEIIEEKLENINKKISEQKPRAEEESQIHILEYIKEHLKAEMNWLSSF